MYVVLSAFLFSFQMTALLFAETLHVDPSSSGRIQLETIIPGCKLQVCCKRAMRYEEGHCVIRFTMQDGSIEGCRGGPSTRRKVPSYCKRRGLYGSALFGTVRAECGPGDYNSSDRMKKFLALDLQSAQQNPDACTDFNANDNQCLQVKTCVEEEILRIENACYPYRAFTTNSNTVWISALNKCVRVARPPVPWSEPPDLQPGDRRF